MSAAPHWAPPGRTHNQQKPGKHSDSSFDTEEMSVDSYTSSFDASALEQGEPQPRSTGKTKPGGNDKEEQDGQEDGEQDQHAGSSRNSEEDAEVAQISQRSSNKPLQEPSTSPQPRPSSHQGVPLRTSNGHQPMPPAISPDPNAPAPPAAKSPSVRSGDNLGSSSGSLGTSYSESFQEEGAAPAAAPAPQSKPPRPPAPPRPPSPTHSASSSHYSSISHTPQQQATAMPRRSSQQGSSTSKQHSQRASEAGGGEQPQPQQTLGRSSLGPVTSSHSQMSNGGSQRESRSSRHTRDSATGSQRGGQHAQPNGRRSQMSNSGSRPESRSSNYTRDSATGSQRGEHAQPDNSQSYSGDDQAASERKSDQHAQPDGRHSQMSNLGSRRESRSSRHTRDSAAGSQQGGQHAQSKSNNSQSYSGDDDQAGSTSKRESGQHAQPNNNQSYSGDDDQAGSASERESGQHAHAQPQGSPARAAAAAAAAAAAERTPGDSGADLGEDSNYSSDEELPEPTAPRASHHSDRPMQDGSDGSKRESSGLHAAHAPGAEAPELQQQQQQQAEDRASGDGEGDGSDEDKDDDLFGDDEESGQEQPGGQEHATPSHQPSVTNSFDRSPSPTTQSLLNSDLPAHLEAPAQPAQPQGPSTASDKGQEGPGEEAHSGTAVPQNADADEQARTPVQEQQQKEQQHEQQHEQHDQQHEHEQQHQHQQQEQLHKQQQQQQQHEQQQHEYEEQQQHEQQQHEHEQQQHEHEQQQQQQHEQQQQQQHEQQQQQQQQQQQEQQQQHLEQQQHEQQQQQQEQQQELEQQQQQKTLEQQQQQKEHEQQQKQHHRPSSVRPASTDSQSSQSAKHHPRTPPEQQPPPPKQQQQQQRSPAPTPAGDDSDEDACIPRIELLPSPAPALPPQYHHKQHTPPLPRPRPASASASISRRSSATTLTASALSQHNNSSIYDGAHPLHGPLVAAPFTPASSHSGSAARRPHSARDRPSSAMAGQERHAEAVVDLMRRHPATWGVRDVGAWVEYIGLGQYRKQFMHHCVDGRLLLQISDRLLKAELGIGPLGHRRALLEAVHLLSRQAEDAGMQPLQGPAGPRTSIPLRPMSAQLSPQSAPPARPRRPASASCAGLLPPDPYLGPAMGKVTVYEQRAKLLYELDRAAQRAGQQRTLAQQLSHTAGTTGDEVVHLRGLLQDLERRNKLGLGHEAGGLDSGARIPWRPPSATDNNHVINRHPERFARPGDDPTLDYTFQPRIRPASHRILKEANCQQGAFGSTFMDRLEGDAKRREVNRMEAERRCYAPEALLRQSKLAKDTKVVNQLLMDVAMAQLSRDEQEDKALVAKTLEKARLSSRETEYEAQIDRAVEEHSQGWEMDVHQVRNVLSLRGPKKVAALAGVVRTAQFMHRYTSELSTRDERLQSLQRAWWEKYMGNPKQQKETEDMRQAFEYYSLMGWKGEDAVTDDRLLKLLKRASELKQALEKARDKAKGAGAQTTGHTLPSEPLVDWSLPPWSQDGLQHLQEAHGPPANGDAAATPAKRMSAPKDNNYLAYTVDLLARARWDELRKAETWSGPALQLGLYRMIRTQRFIDFTEKNIQAKEQKMRETYESLKPKSRVLSKEQVDGFYERLLDDAAKRNETKMKLVQEKLHKEHHVVGSSNMFKKRK